MKLERVNMMITANLNCPVNLQKVENAYNKLTKYNKEIFSGLIFKFNAPKSSVVLHSSGKIIVLGIKSRAVGVRVIQKVAKLLKLIGYKSRIDDIATKTATFSGRFKKTVDLAKLNELYDGSTYYEPEIFNGLRLNVPDTKGVLTIFHTGSFYTTGILQKSIVTKFARALEIECAVFCERCSGI